MPASPSYLGVSERIRTQESTDLETQESQLRVVEVSKFRQEPACPHRANVPCRAGGLPAEGTEACEGLAGAAAADAVGPGDPAGTGNDGGPGGGRGTNNTTDLPGRGESGADPRPSRSASIPRSAAARTHCRADAEQLEGVFILLSAVIVGAMNYVGG
jgi:hypothetical protein